MKRFTSSFLVAGVSALTFLTHSDPASAYPETYALAVVGTSYVEDQHWVPAPAVPDSSTAIKITATSEAHANAFNTGTLGASAATSSTRAYSVARITDSVYLNLPQAIPSADGMIFYLQLHGSMASNWNETYPDAYAQIRVTVYDDLAVVADACLVVQSYPLGGLWAPPLCDGTWPNQFKEALNTPYYPSIGSQGHAFTIDAPLYLIMKGMTPAAFNGKELTVQIWTTAEGPASANFLNTLQFDSNNPIALYASSTQSLIPLPPLSTYHSGAGMGIPQTPVTVPTPATLDVDASIGETKYDALTDGLITLRYLFGLTGTPLTNGALGGTATRTDPDALKTHLDAIRAGLDIDGNGTTDALTDGLLIIRYLFGLRGASLINGAVDPLGTRTTAGAIEAYIVSLMP